jgi:hypothetical protein
VIFSVLGYVCEFYKETCVCAWNVVDALKKAACLVAEASFPQGLKIWDIHKGHVFHLRASDCMYHCIGKVSLGPMIGSQGNGHVGCFHAPEIIL